MGSLSLILITSIRISAVDVSCGIPVSVTMAFRFIFCTDSKSIRAFDLMVPNKIYLKLK